ncbi:MAG: glutamate--tRNA ligase [Vampirovibrionales bacterium]
MTIRVRIAPSPTGNLHVGTARAALFNWLFAQHHRLAGHTPCQFVLRIEDTDRERSQERFEQNIYDGLHALGLNWDEGPDVGGPYGPYRQSERGELYQQWAQALLAAGKAYWSYETDAELDAQREQAKQSGQPYVYRKPAPEVLAQQAADATRPKSLRFEVPQPYTTVVVNDAVKGPVSFDTALLGDFVILKSDGGPTYNFANVVDDSLMAITHVIRGEDHVSNTPRQLLLYEAFRAIGLTASTPPIFAHAAMILAPDRTKLSKRFGATAVADYIAQGYLPEAFCNFLSLLGWSPPDGQEIASLNQFAQWFSLDRMSQSPAIFETDKLNFLNKHYLKQLLPQEFAQVAEPFIESLAWHEYTPDEKIALLQLK